ncbi:MAG: MerR family transcriptional regulator [Patescibacteria group bacterium]|nr:MerR family transcriptional regulator [Patescibacteria group bacterium]
MTQEEKWFKIGEVADLLNVHRNTIRKWDKDDFLSSVRIGTRKDQIFPKEEIGDLAWKKLIFLKEKRVNQSNWLALLI